MRDSGPSLKVLTSGMGRTARTAGDRRSVEGPPSPLPVPLKKNLQSSSPAIPAGGRPRPPASLDSYKHNRNKFCETWSLRGELNQQGRRIHKFVRLRCKRWGCPSCGPKKARRVKYAITQQAIEKKLNRFLTLTLDPRYCTAEESPKHIKACWSKLRTYLKRRYKKPISFITVMELQKSGYAHLHILIDRFIPQQWISSAWDALRGGRIVHIKQVDIHRVAPYLCKYLTKEVLTTPYPPNQRRYSTSRDIILFVKKTNGTWVLFRTNLDTLYDRLRSGITREHWDADGILQHFEKEIASCQ